MERIRIDAASVVCGALAGLAAGGVGGYLLHRYLDRDRSEARIQREVTAVQQHYNDRAKAFLETGKPYVGPAAAMGARDGLDSDKGLSKLRDFPDEDEEDPVGDEEDDQDEDGWPPANRDRTQPYVVSVVEFSNKNCGLNWQDVVVTWYAGDGTLADDRDQPIPDIRRTTGPLRISLFEEDNVAGDPLRCYIRNERIKTDFEVILDRRTYAEAVLNYGNPRMPDG